MFEKKCVFSISRSLDNLNFFWQKIRIIEVQLYLANMIFKQLMAVSCEYATSSVQFSGI